MATTAEAASVADMLDAALDVSPYINREQSWLEFNKRVLQEA
ncbi:MAG: hypothetical protein JST60_08300, partial [Chloroflexi bacterium SZAS-1]|nr:hypothetical protein [Chloroflexi bacterium SZAS-1]